jgi:endonuclease YncB( thermonuclease family)
MRERAMLRVICAMLGALALGLAGIMPVYAGEIIALEGDVLRIDGKRVRLWGIDAPEGGQQCLRDGKPWYPAPEATAALGRLVATVSRIDCTTMDRDRFGRAVALCRSNGVDIGQEMVRKGWAFDFRRYSGGAYGAVEARARNRKRGVWSADCVPPWTWRHPKPIAAGASR